MNNRPAGSIRVVVPFDTSVITVADGTPHMVEIEADGTRVVYLLPDDARNLINSGLPCSLPWREANMQLAANLGFKKPEPGVSLARMQHAAWEATRPRTILEDLARLHSAIGRFW